MLKLNLNSELINQCHDLAKQIASNTFALIQPNTTIGIERAVLRLLGVEGATKDELQIPLVNILADALYEKDLLHNGAALYLLYLNHYFNSSPACWIELLHQKKITLPEIMDEDLHTYHEQTEETARQRISVITAQRSKRESFIETHKEQPTPWLYVIVATGNIYEDMQQAEMAVRQGADIIAVIRSTAQSLLDYIPEEATTGGIAGTFATQQNFRLMRNKLDDLGNELGRYIRLTNYASGLCMAEMAALGSLERLDMMLSDSMYGILFRDINMLRTFIDQHFARRLQAIAGMIINTGEDNYLTTSDQYEEMHTVLASQFINRQFAHLSSLPDPQIGLGHAFEMDPERENGLLLSFADALLSRQCFPECPLKYMPPTKHVDGNIFQAHLMNALFNLTSIGTNQHIHLVGILSEGVHTPFIQERFLAIQNARYIFKNSKNFYTEFSIKDDGLIQHRAKTVLEKTLVTLGEIAKIGLPAYVENGSFAGVKRTLTGGKGYEGVIKKSTIYFNPFESLLN